MLRILLPVTLLNALAAGCYSEAEVGYAYTTPSLAYVSPGVQVVYDYDYPVFFSDGFYWRWYGNAWYRSPYWDRGWSIAFDVPIAVRRIDRPWAYSHWRGGYGTAVVRGNHWYVTPYRGAPTYRANPAPTYRAPAPAYRAPAPAYRAPARAARPAPSRTRRY
jgi:hypothetical protein